MSIKVLTCISQIWWRHNEDVMEKPFSFDTWTDDFIELGFHSTELIAFQSMLKKWDEQFGSDIVQVILSHKTVGNIVEALLEGEVDYYSSKQVEVAKQSHTATMMVAAGDKNDQSASSS